MEDHIGDPDTIDDFCLQCVGDGAADFAMQLQLEFAVTKDELVFELLCSNGSVSSQNDIAIVDIDALQSLKDNIFSKDPLTTWKCRMEPVDNSTECGIPHPDAKAGDWLLYWFSNNPDMFRSVRALILQKDLMVKDLKDKFNQSTTSNIYKEIRRSNLFDILERRGQTLGKKGVSGAVLDAYEYYNTNSDVTVAQAAEKFSVKVKSLYTKISRTGERVSVTVKDTTVLLGDRDLADETAIFHPSLATSDDDSLLFVPNTQLTGAEMELSTVEDEKEEKDKPSARAGGEKASAATYSSSADVLGLGNTQKGEDPVLPPGEPKVKLYAGQAMVYWTRSPTDDRDRDVHYSVYLSSISSRSWTQQNGKNPLYDTSFNIYNLWPRQFYEVHVTAVEGDEESVASVSEPFQLTGEELER